MWIPGCPNGTRPVKMVQKGGILSEKAWNESQQVLKGLYHTLSLAYCRRWTAWDVYIRPVLIKTEIYCDGLEESNSILKDRWIALVERNQPMWLSILAGPALAEDVDEEDMEDYQFPLGDDDEVYRGNLNDMMHDMGLEWIRA